MVIHFSVVCDRSGDLVHVLLAREGHHKARRLDDLVEGDVREIIERSRSAGVVFGVERTLANDGRTCKLAGLHDRDHVLVMCADSSKEITDYYAVLKGNEPTGIDDRSFDQGIYDQITRLNNELINAQRELAKTNYRYSMDIERLGLTLANIGSGIIVLDGDGRVEFINEAAKAMLDAGNDVVGKRCEDIYKVADIDDMPNNSTPTTPIRKRLTTSAGKELFIIDSINPLGDSGKVIAFQDITPLEQLKEDLRGRNELLRLMTKVLRHDVLNHLTVVNGYMEMEDPESESEILNKAKVASLKAEHIIRQMKEMENMVLSRGDLQPYVLSDTVNRVMEGHDLDWTIEGDATVLADPALYSVLENMVSNAIRHGGTDRIDFQVSAGDGEATLRISDRGTGIPDSIKHKLFEEGFTFGRAANTGLGLYLARMVMSRYGGGMRVEDNEPQGAVFILDFKVPAGV